MIVIFFLNGCEALGKEYVLFFIFCWLIWEFMDACILPTHILIFALYFIMDADTYSVGPCDIW